VAIKIRPVLLSKGENPRRPVLLSKVGHQNTASSIIKRWPFKYGLFCNRKLAIQIRPLLLSEGGHPIQVRPVLLSEVGNPFQIRPVLLSKGGHPNTACNNGFLNNTSSDILQCNDPSLSWKTLLFTPHDVEPPADRGLAIHSEGHGVESISDTSSCRDPVQFILYCLHAEHSVAMLDIDITKAAEQPKAFNAQIQKVIILHIAWLFQEDLHRFTVPGNLFQLSVHIVYICVC